MDDITKSALEALSAQHPQASIILPRQFLDGREGRSCGLVPFNWNGTTVKINDVLTLA